MKFYLLLSFLLFFSFPVMSSTEDNLKKDLSLIVKSIKLNKLQNKNIQSKIQNLQDQKENLIKEIRKNHYQSTVNLHAFYSSQKPSNRYRYLLKNESVQNRYYNLRHQKNIQNILNHHLGLQTIAYVELENKEHDIADYLSQTDLLSASVSAGLNQLIEISKNRTITDDIQSFQAVVNDLKKQSETLNEFLNNLIKRPIINDFVDIPLVFSLPVSGIIKENNDSSISILTSSNSLITSPARGKIIYADDFGKLGIVVIIDHGQGLVSVLRGFYTLYIENGFDILANEPLGIIKTENWGKNGKNAMLYYELRYNGELINPLQKISGL